MAPGISGRAHAGVGYWWGWAPDSTGSDRSSAAPPSSYGLDVDRPCAGVDQYQDFTEHRVLWIDYPYRLDLPTNGEEHSAASIF
jgi:hypothetical protein